ncbi:uncharacterized protein LOC128218032 [Mya arenaria]|uniref:uncharacterized protein LOC128218032 n=1 Tax=Mya arenaria TaxID=6604 RepID=UPI0022E91DC2|nr:uncharacterized protein LOC128218032 [Mya arenaria]
MGDEFGGAKPKLPSGSKKTKSKKSHDDKINIQNGQPQSLEQSPPLNGYHGVSRVQDYLVDDDMYNNRKVDNKDSVKKNDFEMMDAKYKDLVLSTEQEYLSAKERWKKSGQALRKYFTEKLRFKNERQVEKGKRLVHSSKPSNKHVSKKVQLKSASSEGTSKGIPRSKSFLERMGFKKDTRTIEEKLDSLRLKVSKSFDSSSAYESNTSYTDFGLRQDSGSRLDSGSTSESPTPRSFPGKSPIKSVLSSTNNTQCNNSTSKPPICAKKKSRAFPSCNKKEKKSSSKEKSKKVKNKDKTSSCSPLRLRKETKVSSDEDYELVFDPEYDEVVRRPRRTRQAHDSPVQDRQLTSTTSNIVAGLQYALPYLPERFRRQTQTSQEDEHPGTSQTVSKQKSNGAPSSKSKTKKKSEEKDESWKKRLDHWANETQDDEEECYDNLNGRLFALSTIRNNDNSQTHEQQDVLERLNFETSLNDPFHVRESRNNSQSVEICSGLLDLVKDIDEPFTDSGEFGNESESNQRYCDRLLDISSHENSNRPSSRSFCLRRSRSSDIWLPDARLSSLSSPSDGNFVPLEEDSHDSRESDEDLDQKYVEQILQRCRARGDNSETSTTEGRPSSIHLTLRGRAGSRRGSRDNDSEMGIRSGIEDDSSSTPTEGADTRSWLTMPSSDSSLDADDEFECECEHCQLLRQHGHRSSQIDLTQPLTLDLLERSTYDLSGAMEMAHGELDVQAPTSADSSFDSDQLRRMYMDDYDYLLMERPYNELDWLDIDNTPLSVMLEDVIQQMLSVQPELLADQATPPAPSIVIDMLPTVTLTQQLIDHHQSCSICLCPCELEEIMTQLPCQHIFHPICIQAWLSKSGTCPVCRGKVSRQESC